MAGRTIVVIYYLALIFHFVLLTECNYGVRYGDRAKRLHITEDGDSPYRKPLIIDRRTGVDEDGHETSFGRTRRDVPPEHPNNNPNITTKVRICTKVVVVIASQFPKPAAVSAFSVSIRFSRTPARGKKGGGKKKNRSDIRVNRRATYTRIYTQRALLLAVYIVLRNFSQWDRRDRAQRGLCVRSRPEHNCRIISLPE